MQMKTPCNLSKALVINRSKKEKDDASRSRLGTYRRTYRIKGGVIERLMFPFFELSNEKRHSNCSPLSIRPSVSLN